MFTSSLEAEEAFYGAFSAGDLDAMMDVWARGVALCCIHPQGPRLTTPESIRESWALILGQPVMRSFELRRREVSGTGDFRVHQLEEHISVPGTRFVAPPVLATNIYQRLDGSWRMITHHGSVAPAAPAAAAPGGRNEPPTRLH